MVNIDYNKPLAENLYDILYKFITEDEKYDDRQGVQAFGYHPLDENGEEIEEEFPNSIKEENNTRSINVRQNEILLNLSENLAQAVESWTTKQTFNITEMTAPISVEELLDTTSQTGAPAAPGTPIVLPVINMQPTLTKGTAEIGQMSILASQETNANDAIETSAVKLLKPEQTIGE